MQAELFSTQDIQQAPRTNFVFEGMDARGLFKATAKQDLGAMVQQAFWNAKFCGRVKEREALIAQFEESILARFLAEGEFAALLATPAGPAEIDRIVARGLRDRT